MPNEKEEAEMREAFRIQANDTAARMKAALEDTGMLV